MAKFPAAGSVVIPSPVELEHLLTSEHLEIPDYQRELAWKEEQGRQLYDDIFQIARENIGKKTRDYETHFLGPVVVVPGHPQRTQIIDGQQRLTYLSVLLLGLQDVARDLDASTGTTGWAQEISSALEYTVSGKRELRLLPAPGRVRDEVTKLVLGFADRAQRETHLATLPETDRTPQGRLANALRMTYSYVDAFKAAHAANLDQAVETLLQTVSQCLVVIRVDVTDPDRAFDVFERLNARGVPLGQADLVKNLILKFAQEQGKRTQVHALWQAFIKEVQATSGSGGSSWLSPSDFLQLIFMSTWGPAKGSDLLTPYRKLLAGSTTPAGAAVGPISAEALMTYLVEEAGRLRELVVAPSAWGRANQHLCILLRTHLANKFSLTMALAARSRFNGNSTDFLWSLVLTHSYVFRMFVVGSMGLSKYADAIGTYARRLRWAGPTKPPGKVLLSDGAPFTKLDAIAKAMAAETSDADLKANLIKFQPGSQKVGFYMAYMLEVGAARSAGKNSFPGKSPDLQSASQHLEHILPRNAARAAGWKTYKLSAQDARTISSMWGNLLVLPSGINSSIKDKDIATKVAAYNAGACAALQLPKTIGPLKGRWDLAAIQVRESTVAGGIAKSAWPFPTSAPTA